MTTTKTREPATELVSTYLTQEERLLLGELASREDRSLSAMARRLIRLGLEADARRRSSGGPRKRPRARSAR